MLGRRGEHKESGARYIELIEKEMENLALGQVASVIGRYWSLDREENWDRIEKTYRMLVYGGGSAAEGGADQDRLDRGAFGNVVVLRGNRPHRRPRSPRRRSTPKEACSAAPSRSSPWTTGPDPAQAASAAECWTPSIRSWF